MSPPSSRVIVIDDDASVRRSLSRLLKTDGYEVEVFASASDYLEQGASSTEAAACLVLDIKMPGLNGLELQQALLQRGQDDQIVFITGHGDVPMCARAMKAGAVDFLPKPFSDEALLDAVGRAIHRARAQQHEQALREQARERLAKLTPRELDVFRHLIGGKLNKQIAAELGSAEKTVKIQRGSITSKLGITAVADMVRLAQRASITPA